jgi:uncharacterized repeat protein (TIGR03803 family)
MKNQNKNRQSSASDAVAIIGMIILCVCNSSATAEAVLHSFNVLPHGANPTVGMIADSAGNLYGTTATGGGYGVLFKLIPSARGKWTETVIHDFVGEPGSGPDGAYPSASLIFDGSGNLYGTTSQGGTYGQGTVFKLAPTSGGNWKETIVHDFEGYPGDGANPVASLTFDKAGNLYGTTSSGGNNDNCGDSYYTASCGTVFELSPASGGNWTERVIYNFQGANDGCGPLSSVVIDAAGNLYGTTISNGGNQSNCGGYGTVFELAPGSGGTWTESIIYNFNNTGAYYPSGVILDEAGNLYGTAGLGYPQSVAFELSRGQSGWTENTLYVFSGGADGGNPSGDLLFDSSGNLYGTTALGGITSGCNGKGCGTVFELSPAAGGWTEKVLYSFTGQSDGSDPQGGVLRVSADTLYATASSGATAGCDSGSASGCGAILKLTSSPGGNWKAAAIYDFPPPGDGSAPYSNLVSDASGNLFGTTSTGGTGSSGCPPPGCGTVFELTRSSDGKWKKRVLYSFTGTNGDGLDPMGGLIFDDSGNLYGTTLNGGNPACFNYYPCGTVFKLSPSVNGTWKETVIHTFGGADGNLPAASLIFDKEGNLYGTTLSGGSASSGTVFELMPGSGGWTESVLYSFGTNAGNPYASLVFDKEGNLYGTTPRNVFKLTNGSNGWTETVLYTFSVSDGYNSRAAVIFDKEGSLYGTTLEGGVYSAGTVFKLTPGSGGVWTATVLHNFIGVNGDGAYPEAGLVFDNLGNLYGTTTVGGINGGGCNGVGCGTAFQLKPSSGGQWTERVLHRFTGGVDGGQPYASFMLDAAGNLYGTTSSGGTADQGTVFEIKP